MYLDSDANGAWDAGEIGFVGWDVQLLDAGGNVVAETLTDTSGAYSFDGVTPGRDYTLSVVPQPQWIQTSPLGGTFRITPAPGQDAGPYDFGESSAFYS